MVSREVQTVVMCVSVKNQKTDVPGEQRAPCIVNMASRKVQMDVIFVDVLNRLQSIVQIDRFAESIVSMDLRKVQMVVTYANVLTVQRLIVQKGQCV
jgi:hypothetical protein